MNLLAQGTGGLAAPVGPLWKYNAFTPIHTSSGPNASKSLKQKYKKYG